MDNAAKPKSKLDLTVLALLKNKKGDFFIQSAPIAENVKIGCHHSHGEKAHHAFDIVADYKKDSKKEWAKKFFDQPVEINWAGQYKLNDTVTLKSKLNLNDKWILGWSWIHNLNKNLRLVTSHQMNIRNIHKVAVQEHNFGVQL